jgi:hypothetical protein
MMMLFGSALLGMLMTPTLGAQPQARRSLRGRPMKLIFGFMSVSPALAKLAGSGGDERSVGPIS